MSRFLFRGGKFLDPSLKELRDGVELLTEGERIVEVSDTPIKAPGATAIELGGRTLMPGLIDCHVHVYLSEVDIRRMHEMPLSRIALESTRLMRDILERGFTTVRDTGGADFGVRDAVASGLVQGPRLFIAGRVLGPTGGHGDSRRRTDTSCVCCQGFDMLSHIVDGVPAVLQAAREELRRGADFIKIMASGGVASPYDPLEGIQFTRAELMAITEEVGNWGSYVAAHAYGANAIFRAVECGVRTIEHGNLIDEPAAKLMAEKGAFLVPTLIAYDSMKRRAREFGMGEANLKKNERVLAAGVRSLEIARNAGVQIAYGSDLLGQLQNDQTIEFKIRSEVMKPWEIIQSATLVAAKVIRREGELGILKEGAYADLLVVDGDPYKDLGVFDDRGTRLAAIMKGGEFYRNRLSR
jgi:imidazolonepropionase-like amidohydrolase